MDEGYRGASDVDIAWLAGIVEGEGTIILMPASSKPGSPRNAGKVAVQMLDEDIIRRCQSVSGVGTICTHAGYSRPMYHWQVQRRAEILPLIAKLYPWLGARRRAQADLVIAHHEPGLAWGRTQRVRGEASSSAKLTASAVASMRQEYVAGNVSQPQLAARYGVSQSQVGRILRRESWAA